MKPSGKRPALETTACGGRVLVRYDSVLRAIGQDPASAPPDRPLTVTIKKTQELTGLSARTISRMIEDGREVETPETRDNAA
jgi:hypothetical protein